MILISNDTTLELCSSLPCSFQFPSGTDSGRRSQQPTLHSSIPCCCFHVLPPPAPLLLLLLLLLLCHPAVRDWVTLLSACVLLSVHHSSVQSAWSSAESVLNKANAHCTKSTHTLQIHWDRLEILELQHTWWESAVTLMSLFGSLWRLFLTHWFLREWFLDLDEEVRHGVISMSVCDLVQLHIRGRFTADIHIQIWILQLYSIRFKSRVDRPENNRQREKKTHKFFFRVSFSFVPVSNSWTSVLVFSTDPSELRVDPEVCRLWGRGGGEPAALAGVSPETSPLLQFGSELLTVRHVVPVRKTKTGWMKVNRYPSRSAQNTSTIPCGLSLTVTTTHKCHRQLVFGCVFWGGTRSLQTHLRNR